MATSLKSNASRPVGRRATNISLDQGLVADAKELGINVSRACEAGLARRVSEERNQRWKEENREATAEWNAYIEKHGLPLERFRQF